MKIEIKKIKFKEALSEETNNFYGEIYVNNINVGFCKNNGTGGCTEYRHHYSATPEQIQLFMDAEEYCKTLPPIKYSPKTTINMTMEHYIDNYVYDYIDKREGKKFNRKLNLDMKRGIVYGTKKSYKIVFWRHYTIEDLLKHPAGKVLLVKEITKLKEQNETILNTNLPKEILDSKGK